MKTLISSVVALVLMFSLFGSVSAGDTFNIEPMTEIIKSVESGGCVNIKGNLSITDGLVDFYVTSPSGIVLLIYNKTGLTDFNITCLENGNYTFHIVNSWSTNNVTATLWYGRNFEVTMQENIRTWHDITSWTFTASTAATPTFPWAEPLMKSLGSILSSILVTVLSALLIDYLRERHQKWKNGKPNTPVVIRWEKGTR